MHPGQIILYKNRRCGIINSNLEFVTFRGEASVFHIFGDGIGISYEVLHRLYNAGIKIINILLTEPSKEPEHYKIPVTKFLNEGTLYHNKLDTQYILPKVKLINSVLTAY